MRSHGKKLGSPWIGVKVTLPDNTPYGEITAVYEFGAGEVCDILKTNGKIEMLPISDKFLRLAPDKKTFILQPFEFTEAPPEKNA